MKRFKFSYKETITTILTEREEFYEVAVKAILEARSEIEEYIAIRPDFLISYEPLDCSNCTGKKIVKKMCYSAKLANVGPMASVAGAIAQYAVDKMVEAGAKLAIVDNGGDIAIHSNREIKIGIYPSTIALLIPPTDNIAVCTSSGKIGPSVSFGWADAATVIAKDACIADAFATALGNIVGDFSREEIERKLSDFYSRHKDFIMGAIVIKDGDVAIVGDLPPIAHTTLNEGLITKG